MLEHTQLKYRSLWFIWWVNLIWSLFYLNLVTREIDLSGLEKLEWRRDVLPCCYASGDPNTYFVPFWSSCDFSFRKISKKVETFSVEWISWRKMSEVKPVYSISILTSHWCPFHSRFKCSSRDLRWPYGCCVGFGYSCVPVPVIVLFSRWYG
jgi:hypothetical protein